MIDQTVARIDEGGTLATNAGAKIMEVVDAVKRATVTMAEISVASREQSQGIAQINLAIQQMDDATQRNAAWVEEAAAAAASLDEQADRMREAVAVFSI